MGMPPPSTPAKPIAAVFDFDGTLSRGTSGIRFFRQLLGAPRVVWMIICHLPAAIGYRVGYRDEESLERFNHLVFRGRQADEVRRAAELFARQRLPCDLLPDGMAKLEAHRARGDRIIIVSRGYTWCLEPWARTLGITDVLGTNLEVGPDGRLTGRMTEPSCNGEHKRTRLLALLGSRHQWEVHAYGDSAGDHAMFAAADHAFIRRSGGFERWFGQSVQVAQNT